MPGEHLQETTVEDLRHSKKVAGELNPVVIDKRTGKVVSGEHRLEAGWKKIVYIETKDDAEFHRLRMHYNLQRRLAPDEWSNEFIEYAEALIKTGLPYPEVLKELLENAPFKDKKYAYEFIPDYLKSNEGRPRQFQESETQAPEPFTHGGFTFGPKDEAPAAKIGGLDSHEFCPECGRKVEVTCKGCGTPLRSTNSGYVKA